ncbi:putative secreted glycosidase [Colletotrichum sidae]|uniref:Putative secreted glycosidase n=1 Tax=Colletotrichum sidae TaxID=1347389 RepID=A0A4R8TN95_9PEZI|nr:putative secreted glycosidase [Colletotrichum sidae]
MCQLLISLFVFSAIRVTTCEKFDPLAFVDPLIGSRRGGNVFVGATLPDGLAKAVIDVDGEKTGGFATDGSNITGFSIVHDSGTGGNPSLGNFPLFPQLCPGDDLNNCRFRIGKPEQCFRVAGKSSQGCVESFWSGLYRNMISPQNYTGENPYWDSGVPYFDSYYCICDSFRAQHPLLTVIDPQAQAQMVNSLLDIYKHEGWLPDCRMSLCKGWTQGGSNADVVLVDAYVKNLTSIDWKVALEAITKYAEDEPLEWLYQGRGGLDSWRNLHYIPYLDFDPVGFGTNSRSVSRTLEYSYNDYCLATLAKGLGKGTLHAKYMTQSMNWRNLWKRNQNSLPKYMNGTWGFQDPIACSNLAGFCSLTTNPSETFEASIWQYQFIVPHAVATLIDLMGGEEAFVSRLDYFHASPLADISNEPVFLTVYLYHYAGRPGLSAERIHKYVPSAFNSSRGGLPGNDDSGAMGAFLAFSVMGLFPVAGQDVYLITPPFFEEISLRNPMTGKTATAKSVGFDAKYRNVYIQSVKLDGETWNKSWVGHGFFTEGRTLELTLGDKESDWGKGKEARPPSYEAASEF